MHRNAVTRGRFTPAPGAPLQPRPLNSPGALSVPARTTHSVTALHPIYSGRPDFRLLINGQPNPQLDEAITEDGITVIPGSGHSLVQVTLIAEHVTIEHDGIAPDDNGR